jgi:membrane protease YdiL (CAAX protease family)
LRMRNLLFCDGLLRSGWRILSYIIVSRLLVFTLSVVGVLGLALVLTAQGTTPDHLLDQLFQILTALPALTITAILQFGVTVAIVYLWRRRLDRKSFRSLGIQATPGGWQEFLLGAVLIGLMWTIIFLFSFSSAAISIEGLRIDSTTLLGGLGLGLAFNIFVGLNEELDARGYVLQNLSEGVGFAPAVLISAIYFGALHLLNPGASVASTLGVALFGVLAALGYWATGQLWMSIGMHAAWNFFEGPVFGFLVSGVNLGGIFVLRVNGPEWLTGGRFGPEAGALTMAPLLILIAAVYLWGRGRRGVTVVTNEE